MSDPVAYTFYGTTIPILRKIASTAISVLTAAKNESSKATAGSLPSEQEVLDSNLGDMLPFRVQPILLAKFPALAVQKLNLIGSTSIPVLEPSFTSFDDVIKFFEQLQAVFDAVDEKSYNDRAEKGVEVPMQSMTLHMTGLADYVHGFVIPNAYFHLNAMYMLLRSKGFKLGKGVYAGPWMSEQLRDDWAPLRK